MANTNTTIKNPNVNKALEQLLGEVKKCLEKYHDFSVTPVIATVNGKAGIWILEEECAPIRVDTEGGLSFYCGNFPKTGSAWSRYLPDILIQAHNIWGQSRQEELLNIVNKEV